MGSEGMNSRVNKGRGMDTLWLLSIYRILGGWTHVWWIFSTLTHTCNYLHSQQSVDAGGQQA